MRGFCRLHSINFLAATAIAWIALISVGARQASAADKVQLALLTQPGVWDAGVFAAVDHNFFADEGLEVSFVSPATPADGLKLLASGGVQFATAHSTEVITARSKGLPVVSIATNHQFGTAGIMVPATENVTNLKQLEGKTLGVTGIPFNKVMLEYCLKKAGVDLDKVKIVIVGFAPMPLLLSKRIDGLGDAITWSEPAMFDTQLGKPADDKSTYKYFAFYENGVPRYYTLGVVTDEKTVSQNRNWRAVSCGPGPKASTGRSTIRRRRSRACARNIRRSTRMKRSPISPRSLASRRATIQNSTGLAGRIRPCGRRRKHSCATRA